MAPPSFQMVVEAYCRLVIELQTLLRSWIFSNFVGRFEGIAVHAPRIWHQAFFAQWEGSIEVIRKEDPVKIWANCNSWGFGKVVPMLVMITEARRRLLRIPDSDINPVMISSACNLMERTCLLSADRMLAKLEPI